MCWIRIWYKNAKWDFGACLSQYYYEQICTSLNGFKTQYYESTDWVISRQINSHHANISIILESKTRCFVEYATPRNCGLFIWTSVSGVFIIYIYTTLPVTLPFYYRIYHLHTVYSLLKCAYNLQLFVFLPEFVQSTNSFLLYRIRVSKGL